MVPGEKQTWQWANFPSRKEWDKKEGETWGPSELEALATFVSPSPARGLWENLHPSATSQCDFQWQSIDTSSWGRLKRNSKLNLPSIKKVMSQKQLGKFTSAKRAVGGRVEYKSQVRCNVWNRDNPNEQVVCEAPPQAIYLEHSL